MLQVLCTSITIAQFSRVDNRELTLHLIKKYYLIKAFGAIEKKKNEHRYFNLLFDSLGFIALHIHYVWADEKKKITHWHTHTHPSFEFLSSGKHINLLISCSFDTHQQKNKEAAIESASRLHHKQLIASNVPYLCAEELFEEPFLRYFCTQFSCSFPHSCSHSAHNFENWFVSFFLWKRLMVLRSLTPSPSRYLSLSISIFGCVYLFRLVCMHENCCVSNLFSNGDSLDIVCVCACIIPYIYFLDEFSNAPFY